MTMMSSTYIFDLITSHQHLWPLFLALVPNIDVSIILDLGENRSLNINEKIII